MSVSMHDCHEIQKNGLKLLPCCPLSTIFYKDVICVSVRLQPASAFTKAGNLSLCPGALIAGRNPFFFANCDYIRICLYTNCKFA